MKIEILAAGRLKSGPYFDAIAEYQKRMGWSVSVIEIHSKHSDAEKIKADETRQFLDKINQNAIVIALDERGQNLKSLDLADKIKRYQNDSVSLLQIVIGGADGLDQDIRSRTDLLLSFGKLTWPHMMVRAMLFEQIYRCQQILAGHPYHRE